MDVVGGGKHKNFQDLIESELGNSLLGNFTSTEIIKFCKAEHVASTQTSKFQIHILAFRISHFAFLPNISQHLADVLPAWLEILLEFLSQS